MSNSLYGKLLCNARKHDTETKLVTNHNRFDELSSNPRLIECYPIDENKLTMKLPSDKVEIKSRYMLGGKFSSFQKHTCTIYIIMF